jgi:hypothetical protein
MCILGVSLQGGDILVWPFKVGTMGTPGLTRCHEAAFGGSASLPSVAALLSFPEKDHTHVSIDHPFPSQVLLQPWNPVLQEKGPHQNFAQVRKG